MNYQEILGLGLITISILGAILLSRYTRRVSRILKKNQERDREL
jgi:hypothetical protein